MLIMRAPLTLDQLRVLRERLSARHGRMYHYCQPSTLTYRVLVRVSQAISNRTLA